MSATPNTGPRLLRWLSVLSVGDGGCAWVDQWWISQAPTPTTITARLPVGATAVFGVRQAPDPPDQPEPEVDWWSAVGPAGCQRPSTGAEESVRLRLPSVSEGETHLVMISGRLGTVQAHLRTVPLACRRATLIVRFEDSIPTPRSVNPVLLPPTSPHRSSTADIETVPPRSSGHLTGPLAPDTVHEVSLS